MPALTTTTTTHTNNSVGTGTATILGSGGSSVTWHKQTTTAQPWLPGLLTPNFSLQPSTTDQGSAQPSMTMGIQSSPAASKHPWAGPGNHFPSGSGHHFPAGPGHHFPPGPGHHFPAGPGHHSPPKLPLSSVQSTASLLFTQLTDIFPLFDAWISGEAGSTGEVSLALSGTKDTAMLTAYQLGGVDAHPKHCGASLLDATSCIVQDLLKAEKVVSKGSTNDIMTVMKKLEMHQRNLLTFLGEAGPSHASMTGTGVPVSVPVKQSGGVMSTMGMSTGGMSSGASVLAGSPISTMVGSSPAGSAMPSGTVVPSNVVSPSGTPSVSPSGTPSASPSGTAMKSGAWSPNAPLLPFPLPSANATSPSASPSGNALPSGVPSAGFPVGQGTTTTDQNGPSQAASWTAKASGASDASGLANASGMASMPIASTDTGLATNTAGANTTAKTTKPAETTKATQKTTKATKPTDTTKATQKTTKATKPADTTKATQKTTMMTKTTTHATNTAQKTTKAKNTTTKTTHKTAKRGTTRTTKHKTTTTQTTHHTVLPQIVG